MKLKPFGQTRSVLYSWVLSYLLLALVTLILTGFVYIIARNTIEAEINNSNRLMLENIRNNIDSSLVEANELSMEILSAAEIQVLGNLQKRDKAFYYKLYKATQRLNNYKTFQNSLRNYYIYIDHIDRIITPGSANFTRNYYNEYIQKTGLSYDDWLNIISGRYHGEHITLPFYYPQSGKQNDFAFVRSMTTSHAGSKASNIVIIMDLDGMIQYVSGDRTLLVLDGNRNVLAQSDPSAAFDPSELPRMEGDHGLFSVRDANGGIVVSYIASRQSDWKYLTVTPDAVYWERAAFIRNIIVVGTILCLMSMGLLAFYFVRRNYNVLREITSFIRSNLHTEVARGGDEYSYIRGALSRSIEQKEAFENRLDRQNTALRSSLFTFLLEGRELPAPIDEMLTACEVDFSYPYYGVIAIYIENVNHELWTGGTDAEIDVYPMAKLAVMNILEDVIGRKHNVYTVEMRDLMLCIVNTPMEWDEFRHTLDADLTDVRDFVTQRLDIDLTLAVSQLHDFMEGRGIHRAYDEAQSALAYARALERGRTVYYGDMDDGGQGLGFYPFETERRLINYIRVGDRSAAETALKTIFNLELMHPKLQKDSFRFVIMALAANLLREACANEERFDYAVQAHAPLFKKLMDSPNPLLMQQPLAALIDAIIDENAVAQNQNEPVLSGKIQEHIRRNYTDFSLSIGSVADSIGKSPYYISKMFKAQTGFGILDYINRVRVDAARELLLSGEWTQEQIAERAGFTNVRTFQRAFKKIEGVPPGKLRQRSSHQESAE